MGAVLVPQRHEQQRNHAPRLGCVHVVRTQGDEAEARNRVHALDAAARQAVHA